MLAALFFFPACARADIIYLKSGDKIEGKILREGAKRVSIILDTERGMISRSVPNEDIEKTEVQPGNEDMVQRYQDFAANNLAGKKAFESNEYYFAMEAYRKASQANPKSIEALYNLGLVYFQLDFTTKSRDCLEKAKQLSLAIKSPTEKDTELLNKIEIHLQRFVLQGQE